MSDSPTPARPYTAYNLFFQLEREYILQNLLGHAPTVPLDEVFDPSAPTYPIGGPPLPRRYRDLLLPYDWHLPGKNKRRKRLHRKSHGKIGFHELNERISEAWGAADDDVRDFCARLSDIGWIKHRKRKTKTKRAASKAEKKIRGDSEEGFASFDWTVSLIDLTHADCDEGDPPLGRMVSDDNSKEHLLGLSQCDAAPASVAELDMADAEILRLWRTTCAEDEREVPAGDGQEAHSLRPTTEPRATEKPRGRTDEDAARSSFVDAEYEKFQELGRQLRRRREAPVPRRRNSFNACQA